MKLWMIIAAVVVVGAFAACNKEETAGQKLDKATDAAKAKTEAIGDAIAK